LQDFAATLQRGNEEIAPVASVPVVSGVLIWSLEVFVKFAANRLNCWLCILNEFKRLPLVLALFSSN
jgi:hypothetical protein